MIQYQEKNGGIIFSLRVVPNSSKSEILGEFDGSLKIKIAAPPVDGAANAELIKFLAKTFDVSKSEVEIIRGETSKSKQIRIFNINSEKFTKGLFKK